MNCDILEKIPDKKPVRVFLPLKNKEETHRAQAVFEQGGDCQFRLLFAPGELPKEVDTAREALIRVDMGGPTTSIEAHIRKMADSGQVLELELTKSVSHEQMREFFRVDAATSVVSKPFTNTHFATDQHWEIAGESIDISGSGILVTFKEKIPESKFISLQITLPTENEQTGENDVVEIVAHQVRSYRLEGGGYQVAFHYDDISDEDRDKIIGSCLILQRKMLRLKVRVKEEE